MKHIEDEYLGRTSKDAHLDTHLRCTFKTHIEDIYWGHKLRTH